MKKRMVAGYNIQLDGIIAKGEPMKCKASLPHDAILRDLVIDPRGQFVLIAEVWSHPEGTQVRFEEVSLQIAPINTPLLPGNWEYWKMAITPAMPFFVFRKKGPEIVQ